MVWVMGVLILTIMELRIILDAVKQSILEKARVECPCVDEVTRELNL